MFFHERKLFDLLSPIVQRDCPENILLGHRYNFLIFFKTVKFPEKYFEKHF